MGKLTKAQRDLLVKIEKYSVVGGFPILRVGDRVVALRLADRALVQVRDRRATITDAGRRALSEGDRHG